MTEAWSVERVVALAPDLNSATAGRRLAAARNWSALGHRPDTGTPAGPPAVWGSCQGSGAKPYATVVDLSGPAYSCSCPSRKFPCKHALALLLLWASGGVPEVAEPAPEAAGWLAKRGAAAAGRSGAGAARSSAGSDGSAAPDGSAAGDGSASSRSAGPSGSTGPADPRAAAKRVAERAERVIGGLDDLDRWLGDQVRAGLAGLDRARSGPFETIAARMVDAQAPGVAAWLRRLPAVVASGEGWHGRLLEQYALLHLLVRAHRQLAELPAPLAAAVRAHVGYPTTSADVLALPAVRDTWSVLALRDEQVDRLLSRRVWLQGAGSGRMALVLSYAPLGRSLDDALLPGASVEADVHFYPGGIRALVGRQHGAPGLFPRPATVDIAAALAGFAAALAADPWTSGWPVVLGDVAPVRLGERWVLRDEAGQALPIAASSEPPWTLLACSGGEPVTVAGEWAPAGFTPLTVIRGRQLVRL